MGSVSRACGDRALAPKENPGIESGQGGGEETAARPRSLRELREGQAEEWRGGTKWNLPLGYERQQVEGIL